MVSKTKPCTLVLHAKMHRLAANPPLRTQFTHSFHAVFSLMAHLAVRKFSSRAPSQLYSPVCLFSTGPPPPHSVPSWNVHFFLLPFHSLTTMELRHVLVSQKNITPQTTEQKALPGYWQGWWTVELWSCVIYSQININWIWDLTVSFLFFFFIQQALTKSGESSISGPK